MRSKSVAFKIVFAIMSLYLVWISYNQLFVQRGLNNILQSDASRLMIKELAIYFIIFYLVGLVKKARLWISSALFLLFTYTHFMLFPFIVCGIYFIQILLLGHFINDKLFRKYNEEKISSYFEIILGMSGDIIVYAIMSGIGVGKIWSLRYFVIVSIVPLFIYYFKYILNKFKIICDCVNENYNYAMIIIIFIMITIGRAPIAIDYDSTWYGVRGSLVLDNVKGIYENLYLSGCVYTYPKGFEIVALPMSSAKSYGYIYMFNIFCSVLVLGVSLSIAKELLKKKKAFIIAILVASTPGIMNMATTAKPDMSTLVIQIICFYSGVLYVKNKNKYYWDISLYCFILSLAFKPTAIIYSTSVILPILFEHILSRKKIKKGTDCMKMQIFSVGTLFCVWLRTYILTGYPALSIWTGLFIKLGFKVKYPYSVSDANRGSNFRGTDIWFTKDTMNNLVERLKNFYIAPVTEDMDHIIIVWGTVLITILTIATIIIFLVDIKKYVNILKTESHTRLAFEIFVIQFIGAVAVLWIGTKPDGNYFMLYYAITIICLGCFVINNISGVIGNAKFYFKSLGCIIIGYSLMVTCVTNWAWAQGFIPVSLKNGGYYNNREELRERFVENGVDSLYDKLCSSTRNRVMVFGDVDYWNLNCIAEPYLDISYWGNCDILSSENSYCNYLEFTKCDYVFVQKGFVGAGSKEYGLLVSLFDNNMVKNVENENGHILLSISKDIDENCDKILKQQFVELFESQTQQ